MPLPQEEKQYTYADYLTWPEDERREIIDGVPYMQAAPSPAHQLISGELHRQFANYLQGKPRKAYPAPFCVRLTKGDEKQNEDIRIVVEPDITIVCDKSKIDEKITAAIFPDLRVDLSTVFPDE
ncbi:MAG: Uma2 family endonuclease [Desulfitobacteriaceae bacterium]